MTAHHTAERPQAGSPRKVQPPAPGARHASAARGGGRSSADVLALQRSLGNRAVSRLLDEEQHAHEETSSVQRSSVQEVLRGSGSPLAAPVRAEMESRLGADFSDVRLHTGSQARRSAAEIGARAYTSGTHVVIGDGGADKHTLAHELTHVIQQRSGPVSGTDNGHGLSLSDPSDRFEREAEANAARVLTGPVPAGSEAGPAAADQSAPASVQRAGTAVQRFTEHRATVGRRRPTMQVTAGGMFAIQSGSQSVWVSEHAQGISPALRRTNADPVDLFRNGVPYREYQLSREILDDCLHLAEEIMHDSVGRLQDGRREHSAVQTGPNQAELFGGDDEDNRDVAARYFGRPNEEAAPRVGQSYVTVAMNPGNRTMSQYHAAAVVGRDGNDTITMETFAGSGATEPNAMIYTVGGARSFHAYWTGPDSYYLTNHPRVTMRTIVAGAAPGPVARRRRPRPSNPNVRR